MPVNFSELVDAFSFVSSSDYGNEAYIDRRTGSIYWRSDIVDVEEELPEDIDSDHYLGVPDRRDLGLGNRLALNFAYEHLPDDSSDVETIFRRRGAYARFKDLLARRGVLEKWYAYSDEAEQTALREWCESEELEIADASAEPPRESSAD